MFLEIRKISRILRILLPLKREGPHAPALPWRGALPSQALMPPPQGGSPSPPFPGLRGDSPAPCDAIPYLGTASALPLALSLETFPPRYGKTPESQPSPRERGRSPPAPFPPPPYVIKYGGPPPGMEQSRKPEN